jgi:hypothetical protein
MSPIKIFTEEDVQAAVAVQLRAAGFDAIATPEANRLGESDPSPLLWAAQQLRMLATYNVSDFVRIYHEWINQGLHHAGIVVSRQRPIGDLLRRLLHLARTLSAEEMEDRLEYLCNW